MADGYPGFQQLTDLSSDFNVLSATIWSILSRVNTLTLVRVVAVTNAGDAAIPGFVDVQPLVNQINGAQQATPLPVIHHCPYLRLQAGQNAIILDPQVGDVGIVGFAGQDISTAIKTQAPAPPGSLRRFDLADGLYLGGILGSTAPNQYIQFSTDGITLQDANNNSIQTSSAGIQLQDMNGNSIVMNATGVVINGVPFSTHIHSGVQTGSGDSGPPVG